MRSTVLPLAGTDAGRTPLDIGAGGDRTMELDRAAEAVVFDELYRINARGERFVSVYRPEPPSSPEILPAARLQGLEFLSQAWSNLL